MLDRKSVSRRSNRDRASDGLALFLPNAIIQSADVWVPGAGRARGGANGWVVVMSTAGFSEMMDEYLCNREEKLQSRLVKCRYQTTLTRNLFCWTKRTTTSDVMSVVRARYVAHSCRASYHPKHNFKSTIPYNTSIDPRPSQCCTAARLRQ